MVFAGPRRGLGAKPPVPPVRTPLERLELRSGIGVRSRSRAIEFTKTRYSTATDWFLEDLTRQQIRTVHLCDVDTDACVMATALMAIIDFPQTRSPKFPTLGSFGFRLVVSFRSVFSCLCLVGAQSVAVPGDGEHHAFVQQPVEHGRRDGVV